MSRENRVINLRDAQSVLPTLDAAAKSAAALKAAMFDQISEGDVAEITAGLVKRAKEGHAPSIKLLFEMIGKGTPQVSVGVRVKSPNANGNGHARPAKGDRLVLIADRVSAVAQAIAARGPSRLDELARATRYSTDEVQDAIEGPRLVQRRRTRALASDRQWREIHQVKN